MKIYSVLCYFLKSFSFYKRALGIAETNYEPKLTHPISVSVLDRKTLLGDDVVDTGKSASLIKAYIEKESKKQGF